MHLLRNSKCQRKGRSNIWHVLRVHVLILFRVIEQIFLPLQRNELFILFSALHSWDTINSKFGWLTSSTLHLVNKCGVAEQILQPLISILIMKSNQSRRFSGSVFVIFSGKTGSGLSDFCCFTTRTLASFSFLEHRFRFLLTLSASMPGKL